MEHEEYHPDSQLSEEDHDHDHGEGGGFLGFPAFHDHDIVLLSVNLTCSVSGELIHKETESECMLFQVYCSIFC